MFKLFIVEFM